MKPGIAIKEDEKLMRKINCSIKKNDNASAEKSTECLIDFGLKFIKN